MMDFGKLFFDKESKKERKKERKKRKRGKT